MLCLEMFNKEGGFTNAKALIKNFEKDELTF